jgi:sugar lactone lactonase YvrE
VHGRSLGAATSYQLTGPIGVAVDSGGDVYFTDGTRVYEVEQATGQVLVIAGTGVQGYSGDGGPGPRARLTSPAGIAVAANGDVYFEDGNRVRKVSAASGIISTVAGNGHQSPTDYVPSGPTGNGGPAIRASLDFSGPGTGPGSLSGEIAVGPGGDLYIADTGYNEVQKVSPTTGIITRVTGSGHHCAPDDGVCYATVPPCEPVGVAVDHSSNVFVATSCGEVRELSGTTGTISTVFSAHQSPVLTGQGSDQHLDGLAVLDNQKLLVTEADGRRLLEIDLRSEKVTLVAGTGAETIPEPHQTAGDGGPAAKATFGSVAAVAIDRQGNTYVADFFNDAIRRIDARTGLITTVAGQIPTSAVQQGHCC